VETSGDSGQKNNSWDAMERRAESERRATGWEALERRDDGERRVRRRRTRKGSHRRMKNIKKTGKTLLITAGICFFAALLITYVTGGLPNLIDGFISKNVERAIQDTTASFLDDKSGQGNIEEMVRRLDIGKLKAGGSDDNVGKLKDQYKQQYKEMLARTGSGGDNNIERLKEQYKDKYKEMVGR